MDKFLGNGSSLKYQDTVCIGWLANKRIKSNLSKTIIHNLTEFFCGYAVAQGFNNQIYGDTVEELCEKVNDSFSHLLVIKIGMVDLRILENFKSWFYDTSPTENIIGHILDKGDEYYELHPQFLLIKMKWWNSIKDKTVGNFDTKCGEWQCTKPLRSEENFHDNYTPLWVKPGSKQNTYINKRYGWNIIKQALEDPNGVGIWQEDIREQYEYSYPETGDWYEKFSKLLGNLSLTKNIYYCSNTEEISGSTLYSKNDTIPSDSIGETWYFVTTAGGLAAPFTVYNTLGWKAKHVNVKVLICDISLVSINAVNSVYNDWDCDESWEDFILDWGRKTVGDLYREYFLGLHNLKDFSNWISEQKDFLQWYKEVYENKKCVVVKSHELDLFNVPEVKKLFDRKIFNQKNRSIRVVINTSNVYNYKGTSYLLSYSQRKEFKDNLINYINTRQIEYNNSMITTTNRLTQGSDLTSDLLKIFPWSNNGAS